MPRRALLTRRELIEIGYPVTRPYRHADVAATVYSAWESIRRRKFAMFKDAHFASTTGAPSTRFTPAMKLESANA